jgi:DNA-binding NarL/FixJ family response regulator
MHSGPAIVQRMRMAGADGFVVKSEAPRVIVQAIQQVLLSRSYFHVGACFNSPQEHLAARYILTDRELDVMRLLAKDLVNKEIATQLDISVRTVESHRASIFEKMHVNSLGELVGIAVREQLV